MSRKKVRSQKWEQYVKESVTNFWELLTEAIKDSMDKMMQSFDKFADDTRTEQVSLS